MEINKGFTVLTKIYTYTQIMIIHKPVLQNKPYTLNTQARLAIMLFALRDGFINTRLSDFVRKVHDSVPSFQTTISINQAKILALINSEIFSDLYEGILKLSYNFVLNAL